MLPMQETAPFLSTGQDPGRAVITIDELKRALVKKSNEVLAPSLKLPLSDEQCCAGFEVIADGESSIRQRFIIPQLKELFATHFGSRTDVAVLEIGPGPSTVLDTMYDEAPRTKITKYTAHEPNAQHAKKFDAGLRLDSSSTVPFFPFMKGGPNIRHEPFGLGTSNAGAGKDEEKYDLILFSHSMYGMEPKNQYIARALEFLTDNGVVVVFHRDSIEIEGLVSSRTAIFPKGKIQVADDDHTLDLFARFIAGFSAADPDVGGSIQQYEWRRLCRILAKREEDLMSAPSDRLMLTFGSPTIMLTFTRHATALPDLLSHVPLMSEIKPVKNWEAKAHRPAAIVKPTSLEQIQYCIRWAIKCEVPLTVIGGSHSGHCVWPNTVAVTMEAFNKIHILKGEQTAPASSEASDSFVVAETGCNAGEILRTTLAEGLTVPLGARPSVGAGLWLQGGIGRLSRLHGLTCDNIVGAVGVSLKTGEVFYVGHVPEDQRPVGALRPKEQEEEEDILWGIRGAGTNFGIVVSVTFVAQAAPTYIIRSWVMAIDADDESERKWKEFHETARNLPVNCTADAYFFRESGRVCLGVMTVECINTGLPFTANPAAYEQLYEKWGPAEEVIEVDSIGLLDADMYMHRMHGGHTSGKLSSFKRCVFLKATDKSLALKSLTTGIRVHVTPQSYFHLLQGGGRIRGGTRDGSFCCRDWDYACVITGVWDREHDATETARSVVRWVYNMELALRMFSCGVYGADLGPDPRDACLAKKAYASNQSRLAVLKHNLDPHNVLAYTCPLGTLPKPALIILVTGDACVGKDYSARIWQSVLSQHRPHWTSKVKTESISDETKREFAAATGADLYLLLHNRIYKEQHRPALTKFFQEQVELRPLILQEHFLSVVNDAIGAEILLITGMRDKAPVAALSHLVPESKIVEVRVQSPNALRQARGTISTTSVLTHRPDFIFGNDIVGDTAAIQFAEQFLVGFTHPDLRALSNMVRSIPNTLQPDIVFRHILGISQHPRGLSLCTSLLRTRFSGDWSRVGAIVTCELGGVIFASALASQVNVPLVLVRKAGKLPQPTVSMACPRSFISGATSVEAKEERIEMERDVIPPNVSVVIVDDVLSSGVTMSAVLRLLLKAGIGFDRVSIMAVAEFPVHCGRKHLLNSGFGLVPVQSLLVFPGG